MQTQNEIPGSPTSHVIPLIPHRQCGLLGKAVIYGRPRHSNSRQTCYQQTGGLHAQCEKDMAFINQSFSLERVIIFAKTLGNTNHLCLRASGNGPRPDSSKGSGAQLLFFSSWLSVPKGKPSGHQAVDEWHLSCSRVNGNEAKVVSSLPLLVGTFQKGKAMCQDQ